MKFAPICVFLVISLLLFLILIGVFFLICFFFKFSLAYPKKLSTYKCGFDLVDDAKNRFDIQFYLFLFYLLYLIWKSFFNFLGQFLLIRLVCLDFGLW
jgi:NADH:ubiquinone oxidoreductase subunit 3 (subunit A)